MPTSDRIYPRSEPLRRTPVNFPIRREVVAHPLSGATRSSAVQTAPAIDAALSTETE